MLGCSTKHQEFTYAKGDPQIIEYLIQIFELSEIVSFDESNRLITTTIQHDRYIRLSDLLKLNTSNVINFTSLQYMDIMLRLFEQLEIMQYKKIQHGNIQLENIVLDLKKSFHKLDNQNKEIVFELKLIHFAQLNDEKHLDDYQQICRVYQHILQNFPQLSSIQDFKETIADFKNEINEIKSFNVEYYFEGKFWKPDNMKILDMKYKRCFIQNNMCSEIIVNLHKYYLLTNHYIKLGCFDFNTEPQHFQQACEEIQNFTNIQSELKVNQRIFMNYKITQEQVDDLLYDFEEKVQQKLVIYLKQNGYFQNINKLIQIISNSKQANSHKQQIIKVQQDKLTNFLNIQFAKNLQLPQVITEMYGRSACIFKDILQKQQEDTIEYNHLIDTLYNIKEIGLKESKPLIEYCIKVRIGGQLKESKQLKEFQLLNIDNLVNFMVSHWVKWIDEYISNFQLNNQKQLDEINKQTFILFMKEYGFEILQKELRQQIKEAVDAIFLKLNQ